MPADLKKIQTSLPRTCNDNCLISLALKRRLSDKGYHRKQNIRPAKVNQALEKLREINPFYQNVTIDNSWENISQRSDPELLKTENAQFLPAHHYFCLQDIKISFDQADFYTKISLILNPSGRNSITQLTLM